MTTSPEAEVRGFDDKPRKSFRLPKWAIISGVIIVLLLAVALIIPSFLDQAKYKDMVIQKVEEATGYKVSWAGDLGIAILPVPHVTINEVTVAAGSQKIIGIKKAEISVALAPLLQKKVQISSVNLVEPDISLVVDASGRQTWMTDKLTQQKDAAAPATTTAPDEKKKTQEISLDSIHVENGHILFKDMSKGTTQEITAFNTNSSVKSLSGPFDVKASLVYNGNEIVAKGKVAELLEGKPASVDFEVGLPKLNVTGNYKGEITTGDAMVVKGDLELTAKDLEKTISAASKKDTKLPDGLNGELNLNTALLYDGDNASLDNATISLGDISYKGAVKVTGLKSTPSPKLAIDLTSTSKKGKSSDPLISILSDLSVKGAGTFVNNVVTIEQGNINFDGQSVNLAGTYALPAKAGARARVNANITAAKIDVDDLSQQLNPATESAAQKAVNAKLSPSVTPGSIKGFTLPFDGTIAGAVGSLNVGGKNYSNVNFNILSNGNALTINNFSLNAVADTSIAAKGVVADLSKLSGFDIAANVKTGNVEGLAKAYDVPLKLEQTLGAASVSGNFKGSLDRLSFNATVDALKFAVSAAGTVGTPLATPQIEALNLRVQHPSLQEAVRNFSPGFEAPGSFAGALDLSTTLALKDKKYDLSNIKGAIGTTVIAGALSADTSGAKPSLSGNLNFGNMVFDSPAPKAGTTTASAGSAAAPAASSETRWSREAIDTSWMDKFNADLTIKAASITQGLWKLSNANLAFKLNDGSLVISNMGANLFGGNIAINGDMKAGSSKAPLAMNWTAKATTLNAQQLLSAMQNKQADTLSGTIKSFDVNISSAGNSPAALVYALNGKGAATGSNLVIKGVDAAKLADAAKGSYKPLERAGSLFGSFKDGQTAFDTFDMAFNIASGVVNFTQLKFDGPQATLSSTGNVNLPAWTISLKNTMTVKNSEIPAFDFTIAGPLDNPLQAGGSTIENFLRQKAQAKIENLITDKLGKKLGIPLGGTASEPATTQPASATTTDGTSAPVEKTKEEKKAEQIQEGVKALQGLFGH